MDILKNISLFQDIEPSPTSFNIFETIKNEDDFSIKTKYNSFINEVKKKEVNFILKKHKTSFIVSKTNYKKKEKNNIKKDNNLEKGRWKKEERIKFALALWEFGTDWKKIKNSIPTRTSKQIRSHAQKYLIKLNNNLHLLDKSIKSSFNWEDTMSYLNKWFSQEQLLIILTSIECEIGDNKRETQRYLERNKKSNAFNNLKEGFIKLKINLEDSQNIHNNFRLESNEKKDSGEINTFRNYENNPYLNNLFQNDHLQYYDEKIKNDSILNKYITNYNDYNSNDNF